MNYLGHLYLSGNDEEIIVGNFIGDYVKGKSAFKYPDKIRDGILLHRQIDTFTDNHPEVLLAKKLFRKDYGLYSGIVVDFLYDHFLAANWNSYSNLTLSIFTKQIHRILLSYFDFLPSRVQGFLPFLIQNRRLESYESIDGIIQALKIMSNYTSLPEKSNITRQILEDNYDFLSINFQNFITGMIDFVSLSMEIILEKPNTFNK